ncbi:MAG: hypothetical protein K2K06_01275 [Oscillospiraceae bacterium]|nr:hypothetical protein [Oscillospiraceae bacterium]
MKSYEQMAKDVLKRRDEYLFKKQQRKIAFKHYMPMGASLCFAVLVGLGVWQELKKLPETPSQSESKIDTSLDNIISETSATEMQSEQTSQTTVSITDTTEHVINTTFTESTEFIMTSTTNNNANTIQTSVITTQGQSKTQTSTEEKFPISTIVTVISPTNSSTSKIVTTSVSPTEATAIVNTGTNKTTTITSTQSSTVTNTTTRVSESEIVIPSTDFIESTEFIESTTVSTTPPDPIEPDTTNPEFMEPTEIETDLPTPEQYKTCILEFQEQTFQYKLAYLEILSEKIAGYLQQVELTSYDGYGIYDNYYANAYEILTISPQDAIAVKFDDREEYFIYININLTSEQQDLLLARL